MFAGCKSVTSFNGLNKFIIMHKLAFFARFSIFLLFYNWEGYYIVAPSARLSFAIRYYFVLVWEGGIPPKCRGRVARRISLARATQTALASREIINATLLRVTQNFNNNIKELQTRV